jgi:hypothetical protein
MKNHDPARPIKRRHWRKGLLTLAICTGMFGPAYAQNASQYVFSTASGGSLADMTGATTLVASGTSVSAITDIGFTFMYEGVPYTQFSVNQAGNLRFGTTLVQDFQIQNIGPDNVPYIMAFSGEANNSASSVVSLLTGSEPLRTLIIQWNLKLQWGSNCTFQALLHEGSNVIEFRYGSGGVEPYQHRVAIVGANAANYQNVQPAHTSSTTNAGATNFWPGAGRSYTFTPPVASCAGPTPGNTMASATTVCPLGTVNLSLQNPSTEVGVTNQWESSTDGIAWSPIAGATNTTYTTGALSTSTWFRCVVTCSVGPVSTNSTPVEITVSAPAPTYYVYTGTQYVEDFNGWANRCSTNDVPDGPSYWANTPAYGAGTWRRSSTTEGESGWDGVGQAGGTTGSTMSGEPNQMPVVQPAARFRNNFGSQQGALDFHVDMSAGSGAEFLRFEYINSFGGGTLAVLVSTDGGATFSQVGATLTTTSPSNTWTTQQFTIGSTSPTTVIRLLGSPGPGNNIGVDNFRIIPAATCTAPTAPTATVTGPGAVDIGWNCAGCTGAFYVEYGNTGFALGTGTVAGPFSSVPATINGLPNGNYQAYVRQDCGVDGISDNTAPVAFSIVAGDFCGNAIDLGALSFIDWGTVANTTGAGNDVATSACAAAPGPDVVLYYDVEPGATLSLGLWSSANRISVAHGGSCPGTTSLACAAGGYFAAAPHVQTIEGYPTLVWTNTNCDTERLYILADGLTTGGPVYAFNHAYTSGGSTCQAVTGVAATVTGASEAGISWNASCSGNVIVEYGEAGFIPGLGATAGGGTAVPASGSGITLTDLIAGQPYDVYVRQDCGGDVYSANSTVVSFMIVPGENCSVAIDLGNEVSPLFASTAGTANDFGSLSCGAAPGGDLVYFITVPAGATVSFQALHDYAAISQVSFGAACPGTVLTCGAGLESYSWTNATGSTQNVYWIQDGTTEGDFLLDWLVEIPCTTDLVFETMMATEGGLPTWSVYDVATSVLIASGGGDFAPGTGLFPDAFCLPDGNYYMVVDNVPSDATYRVYGAEAPFVRVIDNIAPAQSAHQVELTTTSGGAIQLPMSEDRLLLLNCDKYWWKAGDYLVANENPEVAALWNNGNATQQANTGYDFWFYDPNGTYSYVRSRRHNQSDGYGNVGSTRTCHMRVNSSHHGWNPADHIPDGLPLNVRVRAVVNGVAGPWGPACRFKRDEAMAACPPTTLWKTPPTDAKYSCDGATRNWNTQNSQRIFAHPVSGATQYRFRFVNLNEGFDFTRTVSTYYLNMGWSATTGPALTPGQTYDVTVQAYKNGTWCAVGEVCKLTICTAQGVCAGGGMIGGDQNSAMDGTIQGAPTFRMWPNPTNGQQVWLSFADLDALEGSTVAIDVHDLSGKRVAARELALQQGAMVLDLNGELSSGMYTVRIAVGDHAFTERLMITY